VGEPGLGSVSAKLVLAAERAGLHVGETASEA
jgi:hypothetical protein